VTERVSSRFLFLRALKEGWEFEMLPGRREVLFLVIFLRSVASSYVKHPALPSELLACDSQISLINGMGG
jgi:hypothetical protein